MITQDRILSNGDGYSSDQFIVVHSTANPGATALDHISYWMRLVAENTFTMARYVTDWEGVVYRVAPDNTKLWEVGNGNPYVYGIELCETDNAAQFEAVWQTATAWAAGELGRRGYGIDRLISHDTARQRWGGTDHTDPLPYFARFGRTWDNFIEDVKTKMEPVDKTKVWINACADVDAQRFKVEHRDGSYRIQSVSCGKYLTLPAGKIKPGLDFVVWPENGTLSQEFLLEKWTNNDLFIWFVFRSAINPDMCLGVSDGSHANCTFVQLENYSDQDSQRWQLVRCDTYDSYYIVNMTSGKFLEVVGGGYQ